MAANAIIVCENLVKIYKVAELETVALQGLDLAVLQGEMLGIVGVSGSGKSTLMNILGGLDRPSAGRVWVNNHDLVKMSDIDLDTYRRHEVGFVWQQGTRNLIPYLSALDNIVMPMMLDGISRRKARKQAEELLQAVELADRAGHNLLHLSGGEQQRVAIAVAMANHPALLLADEPTGELDTETAQKIYQTFRSLNQETGVTIVIVSHDQSIARHVDRVVEVRDGKLATETVRHNGDRSGYQMAEEFQKLVVLDSAGRLQIPQEYLDELGIGRRVHLERTEDGILIRPAAQAGTEAELPAGNDDEAGADRSIKGEDHRKGRKVDVAGILQQFRKRRQP